MVVEDTMFSAKDACLSTVSPGRDEFLYIGVSDNTIFSVVVGISSDTYN